MPTGISLGVRAIGDWSKALNSFTNETVAEIRSLAQEKPADDTPEVPVQVMVDGPYGGSSVDLGQYETAVLIAGGSGITFTLGLLDDIVGRCVKQGRKNGERTRRIEFAWCVRSFGGFSLECGPRFPSYKDCRFDRLVRASSHGYSTRCGFFVAIRSPARSPHLHLRYLPL